MMKHWEQKVSVSSQENARCDSDVRCGLECVPCYGGAGMFVVDITNTRP